MSRLSRNEIEELMEESMSEITNAQNDLDAADEELRAAKKKADEARLHLHNVIAAQPSAPAEPVKHPGSVFPKPLENDYRNSPGRWNGPDVTKRPAALTPAQLDELRASSKTKPLPTFAEKARAAEAAGETLKPSVTVLSKHGTQVL
jgi:hypothetical protein